MVTGVNNIFSLSRFGKLFCKDIVENKKMYLLGLLLTFGVQMIVFCWYIISSGNYKDMNGSYDVRVDKELLYMIWLTLSCVFTTMVFSRSDNKAKLISEIMLPASVLEKYAVKWVVCVLLFPVVYVGVVEMVRLMSYMMLCGVYPNMQAIYVGRSGYAEVIFSKDIGIGNNIYFAFCDRIEFYRKYDNARNI